MTDKTNDTGTTKPSVIFRRGLRKPDLNLVVLSKSHIPAILQGLNNRDINQFLKVTHPLTEIGEEKWIERLSESKTEVVLGIEIESTLVGVMGLHRIDHLNQIASTGAVIWDEKYLGNGYGTDAKMILLEYAFNTLNLRKIHSQVHATNPRSLAYMLKTGYKEEGRRVAHIYRNGAFVDLILTAVFKEDFLKVWEEYTKK